LKLFSVEVTSVSYLAGKFQ